MRLNDIGLDRRSVLGLLAGAAVPSGLAAQFGGGDNDVETVRLNRIGRYATGEALGGAEIVAFHAAGNRLFVVNSGAGQVEVLDLSDPANPEQDAVLEASDVVAREGVAMQAVGGTNSVDVHGNLVAAAIEADPATADGAVAFYDASSLEFVDAVPVGPLPDKVTFSPDGNYVVVANEGEPGESTDPAGSVSVIDVTNGVDAAVVRTATFDEFDGQEGALREEGVHLVSPNEEAAVASTVIEPEFVAVTPDSERAFVSLQENNAIATVDLADGSVLDVHGLGFKDFSLPGNELDTSDADGSSLQNWPVHGMYQPDAIDAYEVGGETYLVTANEGDAKDFEVSVLGDLDLDPEGFELSENPYVESVEELKRPEHLGNLEVNEAAMAEFADENGDGSYTDIYAIGGRSFTVWHATEDGLDPVFDSGRDFEETFAERRPAGHQNVVESGPETESAELGTIGDRTFAFVGQEVGSAIFAYDVTRPEAAEYVQMAVDRDYSVTEDDLAAAAEEDPDGDEPARAGDFAPEGVHFVPATESPIRNPLLCVGYELSGTVGVFKITPVTGSN
ncbi:alkaline phosphatase [Haloplanus rallus]|uniref:Alkaline phosphatase n=1 Tax=Haloplanus rallus TaxID=1816183 RepID=A0A6B9F9K5_9EURY|nr:choice-of-anchor I family protein [Haloplanus rallus]QGX94931.1 alkaline phosphatase [Haloplanus rallus]